MKALAAPFEDTDTSETSTDGKTRQVDYVAILRRLDEVVGAQNWSNSITTDGDVVFATLTVHDTSRAGAARMSDRSDWGLSVGQQTALARAAMNLGVGRHLNSVSDIPTSQKDETAFQREGQASEEQIAQITRLYKQINDQTPSIDDMLTFEQADRWIVDLQSEATGTTPGDASNTVDAEATAFFEELATELRERGEEDAKAHTARIRTKLGALAASQKRPWSAIMTDWRTAEKSRGSPDVPGVNPVEWGYEQRRLFEEFLDHAARVRA